MKAFKSCLTTCLVVFFLSPVCRADLIDSKLALVIDVSASVSDSDYQFQIQAFETAFNHPTVLANIDALNEGILVEVFFFSSSAVSADIDMLLTSAADAAVFSTMIGALTRPFSEGTSPADGMILASDWLLDITVWESPSLLALVVGDGYGSYHNDGAARDAAQANGVTINGLAVDDPGYFIDACLPGGYYFENIITADGQCYQANNYADFEQALTLALIDATGTPRLVAAPRPLAIFAFSFLLFTCIRSVLFRCLSVKYA